MEKIDTPITPIQQMISSCSGALITSLFVTPLDVVRIRLQAQDKPFTKGSCFIYQNGLMDHVCICANCAANGNGGTCLRNGIDCELVAEGAPRSAQYVKEEWYQHRQATRFTGTADAMVKIARSEGLPALWSGLPPTLVMAIPATVVYFTSYDLLKYRMGYCENNPDTKYIPVLAGTMARTFATSLISPIELLRTKMQSEMLTYHELGKAVRITVRECGATSLLRGLAPTLLRDVPFSAVYWFGYEYVKAWQMRRAGNLTTAPTTQQTLIAGATSGTIAAILTNPFDVIKTHRQIELGQLEFCKDKRVTSTWKLISRLYAQNGIRSLYAGLPPRLMKITPACAIMITSYEYGKNFFRTRNAQKHLLDADSYVTITSR